MAARTVAVKLTDGSTPYRFALAPTDKGGRGWVLQTRQWEPGDPLDRWRIPLHPWDGGLNVDRLSPSPRTYAKGNCDVTYPGMLLFPPLVNSLTGANLSTPVKAVEFDSKVFLIGGRYVYYYNPADNTLTEDEDLGVGVSAVDAAVFNNELVVACGESTKIFTRATSGTYTQASDDTFAIAFGVVGNRLYRAESTNRISSCLPAESVISITDPVMTVFRRQYSGELIEITTSSGKKLSATPNHPVLTDRGWVAAGLLVEGDNVICDALFDGAVGGAPDVERVNATIGEIFDAARVASGATERRDVLPVDFHGDGQDGDVEVITLDRELWDRIKAALAKPSDDLYLSDPNAHRIPLTNCALRELIFRHRQAAPLGASSRSHVHPLLDGHSCQSIRGIFTKLRTKFWAGRTNNGGVLRGAPRNAEAVKDPVDGGFTYTVESGEILSTPSTFVAPEKIIDINRTPFVGHVFNLETSVHSYVANGVVTHNCTTAPRTLASWTPASPNQYYAGDSTYAVHTIIDYGGIPWCLKADGAYAPDPQSRFQNQTPQLRRAPAANNGKGAFVAHGALWVPSSSGLFRITSGASKKRGPELTFRPDYRFWVRGGVEYGDYMYWLVTDESAVDATFICKVGKSDLTAYLNHEYVYQEWARLDGTSKGYFIAVSTAGTNPQMLCGYGTTGVRWITLGRGGGRDVDDEHYDFGTSMTLETGTMQVGPDLTVPSIFVGVDVLLDYSAAGESLTVSYIADKKRADSSYTNLLDTAEGGGSAPISGTSGYDRVTRYATAGTQLQTLDVKFAGTLTSASGTTRPTIREAWAHGYSIPRQTDVISLAIHAADAPHVNGFGNGLSREEHLRLFRSWQNNGTELTLEIEDYDEVQTSRVIVRRVEDSSENISVGSTGMNSTQTSQLRVQLVRVDRANKYASAT